MHSPGGSNSDIERIHLTHFDNDLPEAAPSFIVQQLVSLPKGCILEVEFGFDPSDCLSGLAERGAPAEIRKIGRRRWLLSLQPPGERKTLDLSDLEAPLPMERVLEAAAGLGPGQSLVARTPCFPRPLLAQLDRRGLDWEATEAADESGLVWVGRPE